MELISLIVGSMIYLALIGIHIWIVCSFEKNGVIELLSDEHAKGVYLWFISSIIAMILSAMVNSPLSYLVVFTIFFDGMVILGILP